MFYADSVHIQIQIVFMQSHIPMYEYFILLSGILETLSCSLSLENQVNYR